MLQLLGTAVVPLCLTLIGMSLAYYGWPSAWRGMLGLVAAKLLLLPALVLVLAHWGFGLSGQPLAVIVMMARPADRLQRADLCPALPHPGGARPRRPSCCPPSCSW